MHNLPIVRTIRQANCTDAISKVVGNLTIESELVKADLSKDMEDRTKYYRSGMEDVMRSGGDYRLAAQMLEDGFSRMLKRQIRPQYLRPMQNQLVLQSRPHLTMAEGYFIPILFTDEIESGLGRDRRTL